MGKCGNTREEHKTWARRFQEDSWRKRILNETPRKRMGIFQTVKTVFENIHSPENLAGLKPHMTTVALNNLARDYLADML